MTKPADRPEFAGKSDAYIRGALRAEAEIAAQTRVTPRPTPAPAVRNDVANASMTNSQFRTGVEATEFREDADDTNVTTHTASAAASRRRLLAGQGIRLDTAEEHAARKARDRALLARLDAAAAAQRVEFARRAAAAGIRLDANDATPAAAAARGRMEVRSDLHSRGQLPGETRHDAADYQPNRKLSAAAARNRLRGTGA